MRIAFLLLFLLSGCTRTVYMDRPIETKIEIYKPCLQLNDIPPNPIYALSLLQPEDSDGEVILAMKQEIEQRKKFIDILTEMLKSCTQK